MESQHQEQALTAWALLGKNTEENLLEHVYCVGRRNFQDKR